MTVFELKGQIFEAGPGVCGSEAEAKVNIADGKDVFVYAWCFDGCYGFTVMNESVYGKINDNDVPDMENCIEQYDEFSDTADSGYHSIFAVLDEMLKLMEG